MARLSANDKKELIRQVDQAEITLSTGETLRPEDDRAVRIRRDAREFLKKELQHASSREDAEAAVESTIALLRSVDAATGQFSRGRLRTEHDSQVARDGLAREVQGNSNGVASVASFEAAKNSPVATVQKITVEGGREVYVALGGSSSTEKKEAAIAFSQANGNVYVQVPASMGTYYVNGTGAHVSLADIDGGYNIDQPNYTIRASSIPAAASTGASKGVAPRQTPASTGTSSRRAPSARVETDSEGLPFIGRVNLGNDYSASSYERSVPAYSGKKSVTVETLKGVPTTILGQGVLTRTRSGGRSSSVDRGDSVKLSGEVIYMRASNSPTPLAYLVLEDGKTAVAAKFVKAVSAPASTPASNAASTAVSSSPGSQASSSKPQASPDAKTQSGPPSGKLADSSIVASGSPGSAASSPASAPAASTDPVRPRPAVVPVSSPARPTPIEARAARAAANPNETGTNVVTDSSTIVRFDDVANQLLANVDTVFSADTIGYVDTANNQFRLLGPDGSSRVIDMTAENQGASIERVTDVSLRGEAQSLLWILQARLALDPASEVYNPAVKTLSDAVAVYSDAKKADFQNILLQVKTMLPMGDVEFLRGSKLAAATTPERRLKVVMEYIFNDMKRHIPNPSFWERNFQGTADLLSMNVAQSQAVRTIIRENEMEHVTGLKEVDIPYFLHEYDTNPASFRQKVENPGTDESFRRLHDFFVVKMRNPNGINEFIATLSRMRANIDEKIATEGKDTKKQTEIVEGMKSMLRSQWLPEDKIDKIPRSQLLKAHWDSTRAWHLKHFFSVGLFDMGVKQMKKKENQAASGYRDDSAIGIYADAAGIDDGSWSDYVLEQSNERWYAVEKQAMAFAAGIVAARVGGWVGGGIGAGIGRLAGPGAGAWTGSVLGGALGGAGFYAGTIAAESAQEQFVERVGGTWWQFVESMGNRMNMKSAGLYAALGAIAPILSGFAGYLSRRTAGELGAPGFLTKFTINTTIVDLPLAIGQQVGSICLEGGQWDLQSIAIAILASKAVRVAGGLKAPAVRARVTSDGRIVLSRDASVSVSTRADEAVSGLAEGGTISVNGMTIRRGSAAPAAPAPAPAAPTPAPAAPAPAPAAPHRVGQAFNAPRTKQQFIDTALPGTQASLGAGRVLERLPAGNWQLTTTVGDNAATRGHALITGAARLRVTDVPTGSPHRVGQNINAATTKGQFIDTALPGTRASVNGTNQIIERLPTGEWRIIEAIGDTAAARAHAVVAGPDRFRVANVPAAPAPATPAPATPAPAPAPAPTVLGRDDFLVTDASGTRTVNAADARAALRGHVAPVGAPVADAAVSDLDRIAYSNRAETLLRDTLDKNKSINLSGETIKQERGGTYRIGNRTGIARDEMREILAANLELHAMFGPNSAYFREAVLGRLAAGKSVDLPNNTSIRRLADGTYEVTQPAATAPAAASGAAAPAAAPAGTSTRILQPAEFARQLPTIAGAARIDVAAAVAARAPAHSGALTRVIGRLRGVAGSAAGSVWHGVGGVAGTMGRWVAGAGKAIAGQIYRDTPLKVANELYKLTFVSGERGGALRAILQGGRGKGLFLGILPNVGYQVGGAGVMTLMDLSRMTEEERKNTTFKEKFLINSLDMMFLRGLGVIAMEALGRTTWIDTDDFIWNNVVKPAGEWLGYVMDEAWKKIFA